MSDNENTAEQPPESAPEAPPASNDAEVNALIRATFSERSLRREAEHYIATVNKRLGIVALENPDQYERGNIIEEIIHYMRWEPHYLFECPVEKLHEYEMALAAQVAYVKSKENQWRILCKTANRDMKRALRLAASYCEEANTLGEREALAMQKYQPLQESQGKLDVFNLYWEKCDDMAEVLIQMDNSLKKTIERRRFEGPVPRSDGMNGGANGR